MQQTRRDSSVWIVLGPPWPIEAVVGGFQRGAGSCMRIPHRLCGLETPSARWRRAGGGHQDDLDVYSGGPAERAWFRCAQGVQASVVGSCGGLCGRAGAAVSFVGLWE